MQNHKIKVKFELSFREIDQVLQEFVIHLRNVQLRNFSTVVTAWVWSMSSTQWFVIATKYFRDFFNNVVWTWPINLKLYVEIVKIYNILIFLSCASCRYLSWTSIINFWNSLFLKSNFLLSNTTINTQTWNFFNLI